MPETLKKGSPEEYRANIESMNHFMPKRLQNRVRLIRLYHWRECRRLRAEAEEAPERVDVSYKASKVRRTLLNREADFHLKFVIDLNDFFPSGDTAEKDDIKEQQRG